MRIIRNNIIPVKGFKALYFFGLLFVREDAVLSARTLRHEEIHHAQAKEMLYIGFYLWYIVEWLIKLIPYGSEAYRNISFEREAYADQDNEDYLHTRRAWAWVKHISNGERGHH